MNAHRKSQGTGSVAIEHVPQPNSMPLENRDDSKTGRRKRMVQELFESQGAEAAWILGLRLD